MRIPLRPGVSLAPCGVGWGRTVREVSGPGPTLSVVPSGRRRRRCGPVSRACPAAVSFLQFIRMCARAVGSPARPQVAVAAAVRCAKARGGRDLDHTRPLRPALYRRQRDGPADLSPFRSPKPCGIGSSTPPAILPGPGRWDGGAPNPPCVAGPLLPGYVQSVPTARQQPLDPAPPTRARKNAALVRRRVCLCPLARPGGQPRA